MYKNNNNESFEFEAQGPLLHISRYQIHNIQFFLESLGKKCLVILKTPFWTKFQKQTIWWYGCNCNGYLMCGINKIGLQL